MKMSSTDSPSYLLLSGMSLMVLRLSYSMIYTVGINTVEYEVFWKYATIRVRKHSQWKTSQKNRNAPVRHYSAVYCTSCAVKGLLLWKGHLLFFTSTFSLNLKKTTLKKMTFFKTGINPVYFFTRFRKHSNCSSSPLASSTPLASPLTSSWISSSNLIRVIRLTT